MRTWNQSACDSLANVRHELRSKRAEVRVLDRERTRRGCYTAGAKGAGIRVLTDDPRSPLRRG